MTKEGDSELRALLVKVGTLLSPEHFPLAMDRAPIPLESNASVIAEPPESRVVGPEDSLHAVEGMEPEGDASMSSEDGSMLMNDLPLEVFELLEEKGMKLEQHKVVSLHARRYLSDQGGLDIKRQGGGKGLFFCLILWVFFF